MAGILIVDDDEFLRGMIADFLQEEGHECTTAENVAAACSKLSEKQFELTISDFNMPRASGLDLLRHIASTNPAIPFILMSAEINTQIREEAFRSGAVACMDKPFKLPELLEKVENVLHPSAS